ncbi:hypothetical protein [Rhodococcus rhodochrous]|uniref:hypothetical protein n=1 Tax=Rhodococcus rhodochrous TaxID=1829 RepID=UPI001780A3E2|nr:hypothetical protein [Rhodococcus rhodochrous]QOH56226.1 hypothetical protein C6Y44_09820 [Rhodococcus rhodochrous]
MSNFERNIPQHVQEVREAIAAKHREIDHLDWGHECDCEYCDRDGEYGDPEAETKAEALKEEIRSLKTLERRLIAHGERYGVKVDAKS